MKRIMLDIPNETMVLGVTYVFRDTKTGGISCGVSLITSGDNPDVLRGEKAYIVNPEDRGEKDA